MKTKFSAFKVWLDSKKLRERLLVGGFIIACAVFGTASLFVGPLYTQSNQLHADITEQKNKIKQDKVELQTQQLIAQVDQNQSAMQQKIQLMATQEALDKQLGVSAIHFMSSDQVTSMLRQLLARQTQLKLIHLENSPADPVLGGAAGVASAVKNTSLIYKHALTLTLQGPYAQTINFLQDLENLPWGFLWEKVNYQVKHYPDGEVTIEIYNLSTSKEWMGV
jgi:MSHA biogenesis protein MshJ